MSPKELYHKLKIAGKSSIYGRYDGVYGIYTISDTSIYFHSSSEKLAGATPTQIERSRYVDISNAMDKYPYSWIFGLYSADDYRISVEITDINPAMKSSLKPEQKNDVYIIRKRRYIIINQNY